MSRRAAWTTPGVGALALALGLGIPPAPAQPGGDVRLTDAVRPPTRVFPGDEIEMTVFAPAVFPAAGRWTVAGRPVTERTAESDGAYRLTLALPGEFPAGWDRLPIAYADPAGRVRYDSGADARDAVALADISDLAPFLERRGRVTGASPEATPGELVCVCGFFPGPPFRQGIRLGERPLPMPVTASTTELWFRVPAELPVGEYRVHGDPAAGFVTDAGATLRIAGAGTRRDGPLCPCAADSGILAEWVPPTPTPPPAAPDAGAAGRAEPVIWLESLGGSTGEVFTAHVMNAGPGPLDLSGLFAVEPVSLSGPDKARIFESVRRAGGDHVQVTANFYCLEFGAAAPPEGVVYRIAPPAKQEDFGPAARAIAAARRLHEGGRLSADTNPESYFHSIRQWSVWTLEQGFDRDAFLAAFLDHTRKNVQQAGREWTGEFESVARQSAEGRWLDIGRVLEEAGLGPSTDGNR